MPVPSQSHYGFHSFPVVDWFCRSIYLWVFLLSLCKIVRSSVILLLPLFKKDLHSRKPMIFFISRYNLYGYIPTSLFYFYKITAICTIHASSILKYKAVAKYLTTLSDIFWRFLRRKLIYMFKLSNIDEYDLE
jgi:hypothetical protein